MSPSCENEIFDDIIITSALHSDKYIFGKQILHAFSQKYLRDNMCQKLYKYA